MALLESPPSTASSDNAVGTVAWSNPSNVALPDNSKATAILLLGQQSEYIEASGYQPIPADAIVDGIEIDVERSANLLSAGEDASVRLVKAGSIVGSNKAAAGAWPNADAVVTYGGPADLWGTTWTAAEINDALSGVAFSASAPLSVDSILRRVYYHGSNKPGCESSRFRVGDGESCPERS